ncbi:TlpA family protein disulfide reductase [Virgisporangium aurantiacum]|uniref:TlpA family protein disulfide reductase n=1 Tax=Virgisporangium aurantiacum TaxID=175570 RepID=UPI00194E2765|nr:hypothetical protein [Virgisporangium aurantiacum]
MPYLIAAVVFTTVLGLLNLLLTLAVLRRLREQATQPAAGNPDSELLPVGAPLPAFTGHTAGGGVVDGATAKPEVLAFLSTTCGACLEQVSALIRYVTDRGIARDAALVVVVGPADDPVGTELTADIDPVATVLREPLDGPVCRAFNQRLFPTFYLVADGVVRARSIDVDGLRTHAEPTRA